MTRIFIGLLAAWVATGSLPAATPAVSSNAVLVATNSAADAQDQELQALMEADDKALDEIDQWIRDNQALTAQGTGQDPETLNKKIRARIDSIRKRYQDFLGRYPTNADGHLAYGTFLNDTGDEELASAEFETAKKYAPANPAVWNNLANYYGEHGPVTNAFAYYAKAIELNSNEPVYYQNLATTVYLFRKDAREFYQIDETHVFNKSLALYQKAIQLDPTNFALACDYAECYYGIRPLRTNDALVSWTNALKTAGNEMEREGVHIHLARIKIAVGRYAEAQAHLDAVTNATYDSLKKRLQHNLNAALHPAETNSVAATNSVTPTNAPAK